MLAVLLTAALFQRFLCNFDLFIFFPSTQALLLCHGMWIFFFFFFSTVLAFVVPSLYLQKSVMEHKGRLAHANLREATASIKRQKHE